MSNYSTINRQYLKREIAFIRGYRKEPSLDLIQRLLLNHFERSFSKLWQYRHSISIYGYLQIKQMAGKY